eukprot:3354464-Rhodomonas_salina.1
MSGHRYYLRVSYRHFAAVPFRRSDSLEVRGCCWDCRSGAARLMYWHAADLAPNCGLARSLQLFTICLLYTSPSPRDRG